MLLLRPDRLSYQILHSSDVQQARTFPREGFTITAEFMGFSEMRGCTCMCARVGLFMLSPGQLHPPTMEEPKEGFHLSLQACTAPRSNAPRGWRSRLSFFPCHAQARTMQQKPNQL